MVKVALTILMSFMAGVTYASDIQESFNQSLNDATHLKNNASNTIKNFNPAATFYDYPDNPVLSQYYKSVTQSDTIQLNKDALNAAHSTDTGNTITASIHKHPQFIITQNDPDIKKSRLIQGDANNIVQGITDQYVDCKPQQLCKTQYQKKMCEEEPENIFQSCKKTLNIDINPHETTTHYTLTIQLGTNYHHYAGVRVNAVTGVNSFIGPHDTSFTMQGILPASLDCGGLKGSVTQFNDNHRGTHLDSINFPSCSNGQVLSFHLSGSEPISLSMQLDVTSTVVTSDIKDRWVDDCSGLLHEPSCQFKTKTCSVLGSTKTIQGIQVKRDCWEETYHYLCHGGSWQGDCKALQTSGCEQIDSSCQSQSDNQCNLYKQTYRCSINTCTTIGGVTCGDGKAYCLDGSCIDHHYQGSQDFSKNVSALSAVSDASKQFDPSSMTIFAGFPAECSEKAVGYSNCCAEKGWGQDMNLDHCPTNAKKLHESRDNNLAIKVGRYCSGPDLFPCLEHSEVYCVFNSKLAKIIQEQGRSGQLHIHFGSAKHPNCLGITPLQLEQIDLSKIDFQSFYTSLNTKMPDINQIQQMIHQQVTQSQQAGQLND